VSCAGHRCQWHPPRHFTQRRAALQRPRKKDGWDGSCCQPSADVDDSCQRLTTPALRRQNLEINVVRLRVPFRRHSRCRRPRCTSSTSRTSTVERSLLQLVTFLLLWASVVVSRRVSGPTQEKRTVLYMSSCSATSKSTRALAATADRLAELDRVSDSRLLSATRSAIRAAQVFSKRTAHPRGSVQSLRQPDARARKSSVQRTY